MLETFISQIPIRLDLSAAGVIGAALLAWVALVYLVMALGVRSGELVWSGRHVSRLPAEQRFWSLLYGVALIGAAFALLEMTDVIETGLIPGQWMGSVGFAVTCLLGIATLIGLFKGSTWERVLFAPITLLGAGLAGWITFG